MADVVPADLAGLAAGINEAHSRCKAAARATVAHALDCGDLLIAAKAKVEHGGWLPWLRDHCPDVSVRTAQAYMQLARQRAEVEAKCATVAHLGVRQALDLVAEPAEPTRQQSEELKAVAAELLAEHVSCGDEGDDWFRQTFLRDRNLGEAFLAACERLGVGSWRKWVEECLGPRSRLISAVRILRRWDEIMDAWPPGTEPSASRLHSILSRPDEDDTPRNPTLPTPPRPAPPPLPPPRVEAAADRSHSRPVAEAVPDAVLSRWLAALDLRLLPWLPREFPRGIDFLAVNDRLEIAEIRAHPTDKGRAYVAVYVGSEEEGDGGAVEYVTRSIMHNRPLGRELVAHFLARYGFDGTEPWHKTLSSGQTPWYIGTPQS